MERRKKTQIIAKKAKNDAKHVEILSTNIIQYLLLGFITKEVLEDDVICNESKAQSDTNFKCDVCEIKFPTKQGCVVHKAKSHTNREKINFPCNHCGEVCSTLETLKVHVEHTHQKSKLKRTLSEMKEVKEYCCTECKKNCFY